jgi:hypothetical protein
MPKPEARILSCNMFPGNFLHLHLELICTGQVYWQEIQKTASWFKFSGKVLFNVFPAALNSSEHSPGILCARKLVTSDHLERLLCQKTINR